VKRVISTKLAKMTMSLFWNFWNFLIISKCINRCGSGCSAVAAD
jgi:hypothetical protein